MMDWSIIRYAIIFMIGAFLCIFIVLWFTGNIPDIRTDWNDSGSENMDVDLNIYS